jgi:hypothetical protein
MLRRKRNSLTSGNCTLRDGEESMVRLLGYEMVWLCCVGRGTSGRVAIGTGKKLWYVCWAMRWSGYAVLEGEQLDEWQSLYVEGRERCYGTFAGL